MARSITRIYEALSGDTALVAAVDVRIFKTAADQGADFPHVVVIRIGGGPENHAGADPTLENARFQVEAISDEQDDAEDVAELVKAALRSTAGWALIKTYVLNERTLRDDVREAWRVIIDLSTWRQEG